MNLTPLPVILFSIGVVLMYSAKINKDPRDVILKALGQKERYGALSTPNTQSGSGSGTPPPEDPTDPRTTPGNAPGTRWVSV